MTFSHPQALWLLALSLPVTLFHFYRGPRRRYPVPSLRFWTEALADEGRSSALRRMRHRLSLALMLLALAAMAIAVAGPDVESWLPVPRRYAIVVDTGPELAAGQRLSQAVAGARELISRMGRRDQAALLDRSGVIVAPTGDAKRLADALKTLPRDLPRLDRDAVLATASKLAGGGELFVFSSLPGARVVPVGEPMDNSSLGAPALSGGVLRVPLFRRARARGSVGLVLRDRGQVVATRTLELDPVEMRVVEWPLEAERIEAGLRAEVAVDPADDYPDDDRSTIVSAPTAPPLVALIAGADADPMLAAGLDLLAREGAIRRTTSLDAATVRVYDGMEPPAEAPGGVFVAGATGKALEAPKIVDWVRDAPFQRDVDYSEVRLKRAVRVEGDPLITSDGGPIATWSSRLGHATLRFGFRFRVEDGDIALRPAFPILLRQSMAWLAGEGTRGFPLSVDAGGALVNARPFPATIASLAVTTLRGASVESRSCPLHEGRARFEVSLPCLLKIDADRDSEWVAVNDPAPGRVDLTAVPAGSGPPLPPKIPAWKDPPVSAIAAALSILALVAEGLIARNGS